MATKPFFRRRKSDPFDGAGAPKIDYKDTRLLQRYVSERGKIRSRRITGLCRRHQAQVANAVKRARELALMPYAAEPANEGVRGGRRDPDRDRDRD